MRLLIDGYNLMHRSSSAAIARGKDRSALRKAREHFLRQLSVWIDSDQRPQTTVVFDARESPNDLPAEYSFEGMRILFVRDEASADEMIQRLIQKHPSPKILMVVSSDHMIQRKADARGAAWIDSDRWLDQQEEIKIQQDQAVDPQEEISEPTSEREQGVSKTESEEWLDHFGFDKRDEPSE